MNTYQKHLRTRKQQRRRGLMASHQGRGRAGNRLKRRIANLLDGMTGKKLVRACQQIKVIMNKGLRS